MTKPSDIKIVFAGSATIGAVILEKLVKSGFKISLVLTKKDKPAGRGKRVSPTPVKLVAEKFKIPIASPAKLDSVEVISKLKEVNCDLIVVAAYGKIFPKIILHLPKFGVLNVHPSLLPKFRGPAPIQFAILQGAKKTGVTIIKMSQNLDEGDIVTQSQLSIDKTDTNQTLSEKLATLGAKLLVETIPKFIGGKLLAKPQNHLKATYTSLLTKFDGKIDPQNLPAPEKFDRMVRAFYPWPGVWTQLSVESGKFKVIKFLPGNLIQVENKKAVTVGEFLNGYPKTRGLLEKLGVVGPA